MTNNYGLDVLDYEKKKELVDDLWEYELHFIAHSDMVRWAEKGFKDRFNELTTAQVVAHHNSIITEKE